MLGTIEAKKVGALLLGVETQSDDYAKGSRRPRPRMGSRTGHCRCQVRALKHARGSVMRAVDDALERTEGLTADLPSGSTAARR